MNAVAEAVKAPISRLATTDDLPTLVRMFQQFVASTQYARYVGQNPEHCTRMMAWMLEQPNCAIFVVGDDPIVGMLGITAVVQPFSGELVASELFWWLDPEHRGHGGWLLRRGERWATEQGARRMLMVAPSDKPRVAEMYRRLGYSPVECLFQRDL